MKKKNKKKKMSKAIEKNKSTVMIKNLYEDYISLGNWCGQTKIMIRTKRTYPLPSSTPSTSFLIAEKLLSLLFWNFQTFSLFLSTVRKIRRNCMSGLFCIANLLEMGTKNTFFLIVCILTPSKLKWSKIYP